MAKIEVMDQNLANKIAAGEVIERVMNVVKELVENSIDAEASEIAIELENSGIDKIKITDNGIGMNKEDAHLSFSRHATSKIKKIDDLFDIETLGFRGEALPSIAAVAKVKMKSSDGKEGTTIIIDGGKLVKEEDSDLKKGTQIEVEKLFYNTPVRLKYLKSPHVELSHVLEYLNKMVLAHPEIKFTVKNDGKELIKTDGRGDLLKVIYNIYGADVAKKMIPIESENDDYSLSGYIAYPEKARSNRNTITTLVNGRYIKNNFLNRVIIDAYHTYIPKDKFPIVVLNISVDPILIDINIHPTKMDIKFSKMNELKELVNDSIVKNLEKLVLIPDISENKVIEDKAETTDYQEELEKIEKADDYTIAEPTYEEISLDFDEVRTIKRIIPKGIVFETYIIGENEDGMYIIDQHAAAERINYEKYLTNMKKEKTTVTDLLIPIKIELPNNEFIIVKNNLELLESFGFNIEEFGSNTFIVRSHPTWLLEGFEEEQIHKIFEIVSVKEDFTREKFIDRTAMTLACRMSIKAHDYISEEDMTYLLDTLIACENPFTCPHGRPTIITYSKYELERLFKRSMN
ncbi:MAG: DNA mismatch repair endonuclease MutL [Bacilli bacterium]|nr:DNA mismatch repair endonuclease MutL [Bacilli bacterium]